MSYDESDKVGIILGWAVILVIGGALTWLIVKYWCVVSCILAILIDGAVSFGLTYGFNMIRRGFVSEEDESISRKECFGLSLAVILGGICGFYFGFGNFLMMLYALSGSVIVSLTVIICIGIVETRKKNALRAREREREIEAEKIARERRREMAMARQRKIDEYENERQRRIYERRRRIEEERREHEKLLQSLRDMRITLKEKMALRALCDRRRHDLEARWGHHICDIQATVRDDVVAWPDTGRQQIYKDALVGGDLFRYVNQGGAITGIMPPHAEIIVCFMIVGTRYKAFLRFNGREVLDAKFGTERLNERDWDEVLKGIDGYLRSGGVEETFLDSADQSSQREDTRW